MNISRQIVVELQYLPAAAYMALLCSGVGILMEQHEHYTKGSYRNRCQVAGANGPLRLSIPLVKGKHQQQPIRDVRIAYHEPWQAQHWQSIKSGYGSAPYFIHYAEFLHPYYIKRCEFLFDFNWELLQTVISLLRLPVTLQLTDTYQPAYTKSDILDMREAVHPTAVLPTAPPYPQVFTERYGFLPHLSVVDLLFCLGPTTLPYLQKLGNLMLDHPR
ncbi:MAG: WbqC family protein [Saprospiraceae bacterium]|nr:WbqC family protein [Saprospiraceae bacterium]